jgi:hypothetical protein
MRATMNPCPKCSSSKVSLHSLTPPTALIQFDLSAEPLPICYMVECDSCRFHADMRFQDKAEAILHWNSLATTTLPKI